MRFSLRKIVDILPYIGSENLDFHAIVRAMVHAANIENLEKPVVTLNFNAGDAVFNGFQ